MTEQPVFVLAWVTQEGEDPLLLGQGGRVLFVEHPSRGWEIPGGHLEPGESPEVALLRELMEETGLTGELMSWNTEYYPSGWVGHVTVQAESHTSWDVHDEKVAKVQWWSDVPPLKQWTHKEFMDISEWCLNL